MAQDERAVCDASGNPIDGVLMRGISVSKWQGNIDWAKVASDDISFAFVRMVSYGYEGQITMDETFDQELCVRRVLMASRLLPTSTSRPRPSRRQEKPVSSLSIPQETTT
ncbi:MAG: hypothetical protein V8S27_10190 [Lachnospiraceae bacterium]